MSPIQTTLAKCIIQYLYALASTPLKILKQIILALITFIDFQIAKLRALLATFDILANVEKIAVDFLNGIVEQIKNQLLQFPEGPGQAVCPEFYESFIEPAIGILDGVTQYFNVFNSRYKDKLSYMDEIDALIAYWESVKTFLTNALDVIDDAYQVALQRELEEAAGV